MKMNDDFFVCFIISSAKYRRKLDFCDLAQSLPLLYLLPEPFGTVSRLQQKCGKGSFPNGTVLYGTVPFPLVSTGSSS